MVGFECAYNEFGDEFGFQLGLSPIPSELSFLFLFRLFSPVYLPTPFSPFMLLGRILLHPDTMNVVNVGFCGMAKRGAYSFIGELHALTSLVELNLSGSVVNKQGIAIFLSFVLPSLSALMSKE